MHYGITLLFLKAVITLKISINVFIQRQMRKNGHYDKANDKCYTEISANTNTLKYELILKDNYEVDFRQY